jgi:hypothetical protein
MCDPSKSTSRCTNAGCVRLTSVSTTGSADFVGDTVFPDLRALRFHQSFSAVANSCGAEQNVWSRCSKPFMASSVLKYLSRENIPHRSAVVWYSQDCARLQQVPVLELLLPNSVHTITCFSADAYITDTHTYTRFNTSAYVISEPRSVVAKRSTSGSHWYALPLRRRPPSRCIRSISLFKMTSTPRMLVGR